MIKPAGRHRAQQLTVRQIEALTKPGKYQDGGGLVLKVNNSTSKQWILRCSIKGQKNKDGKPLRKEYGLGSLKQVSLSQARELARQYVSCAREGRDPAHELRNKTNIPDFETVAREYVAMRLKQPADKGGWRNEKHRNQWVTTLERYVYPHIGQRRIDQITTPEIVMFLTPLWLEKEATARRIKQRVALVFQYAKGKGVLTAENPVNDVSATLRPNRNRKRKHHAALDYRELPQFMQWLRDVEKPAMSRLALEFTILTVARTGETVGARWNEIDTDKALWSLPASRMKAGEPHRVPLSPRCIEILNYLRPVTVHSGWVFQGRTYGKPINEVSMLQMLKSHDFEFTVHGFRSCFKIWADETTSFSHAAVEKCLAHAVASQTEAAYSRGELLDKRTEVMAAWASYALSLVDAGTTNVVSISTGR